MSRKRTEKSWLEVLPQQKIFERLRSSCSGGSVNLTVVRGNLFIWRRLNSSLCDGEVLTMNLNRLAAYPDTDCYQALQCTKEFGEALGLIADDAGLYLAIHFHRGLTVLQLNYNRSSEGEFGSGKDRVLCKNISVAESLFLRYDLLVLLQVSWYPPSPDTLALLTSDNFIRLYSLADPDRPLLKVPLLPQCRDMSQRGGFRIEEDNVIHFCLHSTSAFLLHDSGDVSLVSLEQESQERAPKQLMMVLHSNDDNEEIDSSTMLLLETSPAILIVAYKSGMIYHCMYFGDSSGDSSRQESKGPSLYVRERIQIESCRMDQSGAMSDLDMTLSPDPADPHSYFVTSVEGVYLVRLPWVELLEEYAASNSNYAQISQGLECEVTHLLHTELSHDSLLGVAVVHELSLGYAMISVTSGEWECMTLSLKEPVDPTNYLQLDGAAGGCDSDSDEQDVSVAQLSGDNFVKKIENLLHPFKRSAPILKSVAKDEVELSSQKELFSFVQSRIEQLREESVSGQMAALTAMEKKVELLQELKQEIISNSVKLRDEADIIKENSEELQDKLRDVVQTNVRLLGRAERLACKIRFLSPVLSEAEECMKNEMEGLTTHIKQMKRDAYRAGEKSKLFKIMTVHPEIDLSEAQSITLLKELTSSGDKIKSMSALVKILCDLMRTC